MTQLLDGLVAAGRSDLAAAADLPIPGPLPDRVAWLSGRSDARHSALSPSQERLLGVAARRGFEPVLAGFPFVPGPEWSRAGLWRASLRNGRQYLALRRDPATAESVAARLRPLFEGTTGRLLLICGSLGLELLLAGLRGDRPPGRAAVRVVALGPVASDLPDDLDVWVAQGRLDAISWLGYRGPVRSRPWCGHLGYAVRRDSAELVDAACRSRW